MQNYREEHPEYVRKCISARTKCVRRPDRKQVHAFLSGEKEVVHNLEELTHRQLNPELFGGAAFAPEPSRGRSGERGDISPLPNRKGYARGRSGERGGSEYGGGKIGEKGVNEYGRGRSGERERGGRSEYGGGKSAAEKKLEQWKEKNLGAGGGSREERGSSQGVRAPVQERRRSGEGGRSRPPQRTPSPSDFNHIQPIQSWERGSSQGEGRAGSRAGSLQAPAAPSYNTSRTDEAIARLTGFGQVRGHNLATSLLQFSRIKASDLSQSRNLSITILPCTGLRPAG